MSGVDAVGAPKKKKVDWKRLSITVSIVLLTAGATAGTMWYFMNEAIKVKDTHINSLEAQTKVPKSIDKDEDCEEEAEECEEFTSIVGYKPGGLFDTAEKTEIETKITEPYIYYMNNVEAQPNRNVVSIVVEEYAADERPLDYYYNLDVVVENGYSGGWLFGEGGTIDYWYPECMDECVLTQAFVDNYPNNLSDSYSVE